MSKILIGRGDTDLDYPICRPSLDLDFTQEELDPRITFTRGSIGTRVNRNRLIETVDTNQPRFDYDPVTGECKGLLIEESRYNDWLYSGQNVTTSWSTGGTGTLSIDTTQIAPDGSTNTIKFTESTTTASGRRFSQNITVASGTSYTVSVFAKQPTGSAPRYFSILFWNTAFTTFQIITFDPLNGRVLSNSSGNTTFVEKYPNGWWRFGATATATASVNIGFDFRFTNSVSSGGNNGGPYGNYTGDGNSYLYFFGPQVENGAFMTSFIPTSASRVTRSADLASMTGTNFSSWYNSSEGTLYADLNNITTRSSLTYDAFVSLTGTDVNRNVMRIYTQTASGGAAQNQFFGAVSYSPDGSYTFNSFDTTVSGSPQRIGKAILAYKKDDFAFTVNGLKPATDRSGDIPTCNQLLIYGASRFQSAPSGYIKRLTYYPRRLKDNQLQYLTQ
jgi:hypothetical protein